MSRRSRFSSPIDFAREFINAHNLLPVLFADEDSARRGNPRTRKIGRMSGTRCGSSRNPSARSAMTSARAGHGFHRAGIARRPRMGQRAGDRASTSACASVCSPNPIRTSSSCARTVEGGHSVSAAVPEPVAGERAAEHDGGARQQGVCIPRRGSRQPRLAAIPPQAHIAGVRGHAGRRPFFNGAGIPAARVAAGAPPRQGTGLR